MAQVAHKPTEPTVAPKRAKPSAARANPAIQRKPKPEKDEDQDRKSVLLGGGIQAKRIAQRAAANEEESASNVQRKASEKEGVPSVQSKAAEEDGTASAPNVQRKSAETEDATPSVQAKPMIQRMTLEEAKIDEAKKLNDAGTGVKIQKAGFVSSPEDASEREADRVADAVVSSPAPKAAVGRVTTGVQRKEAAGARDGGSDIEVEARIKAAAVGGKPLSKKTRALLEPRFDADFSNVRIHDDSQAAKLATRIGARAFAYSNHIFFNEGQYQPDTTAGRHLLAHELTHTIQQKAAVQRKGSGGAAGAKIGESTGPQASRLGISDALDFFAEAAYNIPGYRMFTILLGVNPINMREAERTAANILRAIVEFLPGGRLITAVLDMYNVFEEVGAWVEEQMDTLGISGASIRASINEFLDSLSWSDIFDLDGVWERAKRIFTDPIDRILTFIGSLFDKILEFVQKAVLAPLAALVEPTEGYGLLKQILGFDPITGEEVERDVGLIIGGMLKLAGQEELWNNIQEANALERIGEWFFTAIDSLIALVVSIPDRFIEAFQTIEITEFMDLPGAIAKVLGVFGGIVLDFGAWILDTVFTLLKIIVEVVAPAVIPYLQKAGKAFDTIINDPIGFVGNLVAAAKKGFQLFFDNFVPNLRSALIQWLTGAMAGANIHIPQAFTLQEILKFVLSVLGLTWENVRPKLVRVLGETAVTALETGFELVTTLVTEGPAAAWQQIVEMIGNLRDMVIEQIISFVTNKVIEQAVIKLVSFLNPAGALIQAIIAIYNTVMFFVERLTQIAQVAGAFIDSIADIAEGKIDGAAAKVEQTMVGLLSLVISFLARLVGLGNVAKAVTDLIDKIRRPIDKAIDKLIDWIVHQARRFLSSLTGRGRDSDSAEGGDGEVGSTERFQAEGESHRLYVDMRGGRGRLMMASTPKNLSEHLAVYRGEAGRLPDSPEKEDTIRRIIAVESSATTIDGYLEALNRSGTTTQQQMQLDEYITAEERAIRPNMIVIITNLEANVPERTLLIPVRFRFPRFISYTMSPALGAEIDRQLALQEAGINDMSVSEWLRNRDRYAARRSDMADAGRSNPTGRDPRSATEQREYRNNLKIALKRQLIAGPNQTIALPSGSTAHERAFADGTLQALASSGHAANANGGYADAGVADQLVESWMARQHALHSPDQVAGGRYDDLTGVGLGLINSEIGANWGGIGAGGHLANRLHTDVESTLGQMGVNETSYGIVNMNVDLTW